MEIREALETLNLIVAAAAAIPCRKSILLTDSTGASRLSRGKNDTVQPGAVVSTQSGYAICAAARKEMDHDREEWMIRMSLRRPETADEIMRIAKAMSRDWQETTRHIALLDADDYRQQAQRDQSSALRAEFVQRLTENGV